jgi:hypothetical protein
MGLSLMGMVLRRGFLALICLPGLLVLAGCPLTSENPLLSEANGEALFGDKFLAVQYKDGFPAIIEPDSLLFAFVRDGGAYVSSPTARDSGVAFEGDAPRGASVESRAALEEMLKAYADVHRSTLNVLASKSEYLAIGESDAEMTAPGFPSAETNCLALAGHPLDTALATLLPKYRGGL